VASCPVCGKELPGEFPFCPFCGADLAVAPAAAREQRKVVTVLFCDVTGSTELGEKLDPEALRALLARYFERMKRIVEGHGGSVEKFIGDAVMAVFGVPALHEDDALRAVRAAVEMRDAFPDLGFQGRIGVTTGEVVTGTEERLATGDPLNVAARLQQAAQPGEILIGEETFRLTRDAVDVEAVEPLSLKGKAEPVAAYRLSSVHGEDAVVRQLDTPMVGRDTEIRRLRAAYEQAMLDPSCQLFTILGPAGVGKSRLAFEFLTSLEDARVVRGRCLPYGEGITYWPVVEIVKQLPATANGAKGTEVIAGLVGDTDIVTSSAEIAWAFRNLLEAVASERPLVCVFDDVHWGEETFLDLVEHVADLSRDAPILLLCMARPELLDRRAGWAGGKVNATSVLLEPLAPEEADLMIDSLAHLDPDLRERIREAAEGNPLFVEEMVSLVKESGDGNVTVPPTIQALLAARLDQLDPSDRGVLERGAVEGRVFHRGAVQALSPGEAAMMDRLTSLVRKELVRPDKPQFAGEDAFRFRHILIRDAAYDALPKATRAELHERFAEWLEAHGADLVELDEILGYHLEQAHLYRVQLGTDDERGTELARRAATHIAAAARRSLVRGDTPAAIGLFERAAALLPDDDPTRLRMLVSLGYALTDTGDWEEAGVLLGNAVSIAETAGERLAGADAAVALTFVTLHTNSETLHVDARTDLASWIRVFEEHGDQAALGRALSLLGMLRFWAGEMAPAIGELELAARHAREAGDRTQELVVLAFSVMGLLYGPEPVPSALDKIAEIQARGPGVGRLEVSALRARAYLEALRGRFPEARELIGKAETIAEELGFQTLLAAGVLRSAGEIELLADDTAAAEHRFGRGGEILERERDWGHFTSLAGLHAEALIAQGRVEEALERIETAERRLLEDDSDAQIILLRARSQLAAKRGALEEAEAFAHRANERAERTDDLSLRGGVLADLAALYELSGRPEEAKAALEQALALYEQKGNVVMAERVRNRLKKGGAEALGTGV
jgi:class 3 adenylate cyclase/tetratricopeptide (TPR) repeat protein